MSLTLWTRYRQRMQRRRLLWRAFRSRRQLACVRDRTDRIGPGAILCVAVLRNEAGLVPSFLDHHRRLGVSHFLIVDNASTDGTPGLLDADDISLWHTAHSYRAAGLGRDWSNWLLLRYGHGHWCVVLDADERLIYPHHDTRPLGDLTGWLQERGIAAMSAQLLDLYPRGPLSATPLRPGDDPVARLGWFDPGGYVWTRQPRYQAIAIRGGARKRVFFPGDSEDGPFLQKTPLVHWNRRYAYLSSTHLALPSFLNTGLDARRSLPCGVLLHARFQADTITKSLEETRRNERHDGDNARYADFYRKVQEDPVLWTDDSVRFADWRQLESLGLMARGDWV